VLSASVDRVSVLGAIALAAVLLIVAAIAILRVCYDGRLRPTADSAPALLGGLLANRQASSGSDGVEMSLTDVGIAAPDGRVTVVQFSGEFCAVCPQTRTLIERVLRDHPGVAHVEVDVADHLDAVRALDIRRTPTVLIVDGNGRALHRVSGMPREGELRQALTDLVDHR